MARLKLTLAYDGTSFAGWQLQPNRPTVQGLLENALAKVSGAFCRVQGAGRTDAGVHALGQVAHVDVPDAKAGLDWVRALNSQLPRSVRVTGARPAAPEFNARFDALSKTYSYTLWPRRDFVWPQRHRYVWDCGPLDLAAMDEAAGHFTGSHDFAAFMNLGSEVSSTVRTVTSLSRHSGLMEGEIVWRICSQGFLKQMVRNIVGCLVAVGRGKVSPDSVRSILAEADRTQAPATAPAKGLCLERIDYRESGRGQDRGTEP